MHTPDCGKVPYPNPATAWRTIRALTSTTALLSHKRLHKACAAYRCQDCHQWHITHRQRDHLADWPQRRAALIKRERRT